MENDGNVATKEEGLQLLKAGKVDDAIAVFEKVLKSDEDNAQVHMYLGVAYNHKHDRLHAIHHLETSLNLEENPKGYYNLGLVYQEAHRIDEAVRSFKMALELDPNYELARKAIDALHSQHAAAHPEAAAAQPVQAAAAPPPAPGQPAPPPPNATAQMPTAPQVGAPGAAVPVGGPMPGMPGSPPDMSHTRAAANFTLMQARKEQQIKEAHKSLMKNGLTYGAICGCLLFVVLNLIGGFFISLFSPGAAFVYLAIQGLVGAVYGSLIGLWMGYTAGDESAGVQAGVVLGFVYGLISGLIQGWGFTGALVYAAVSGVFGLIGGYVIGRLVDSSIQQI